MAALSPPEGDAASLLSFLAAAHEEAEEGAAPNPLPSSPLSACAAAAAVSRETRARTLDASLWALTPQALQSVLGPRGPLRHIGVLEMPQEAQDFSGEG